MSVGENFKLSVHFPDRGSLAIILLIALYFMVQVTVTKDQCQQEENKLKIQF